MILIDSFWYSKKNIPLYKGKLYPGLIVVSVHWPRKQLGWTPQDARDEA